MLEGEILESQEFLSASRLHQLPTTTCPNCQMVWLAPGLQNGDTYECKSCELSFYYRGATGKVTESSQSRSESHRAVYRFISGFSPVIEKDVIGPSRFNGFSKP